MKYKARLLFIQRYCLTLVVTKMSFLSYFPVANASDRASPMAASLPYERAVSIER